MKNIAVTPKLNSFGGTRQCVESCIEALKENGINPIVYKHIPKKFVLYSGIFKNIKMLFNKNHSYIFDFTNSLSYNQKNYFNYINFPEYIAEERGKYNKGIWRLYYLPKKLLNPLSKWIMKNSKIDFACNSKYTARRIYETTGRKIRVIYPPCNINNFKNNTKKIKQIISIGGFTEEKNQLMQVEISKSFPNIILKICGSASRNPRYLSKIYNISKDLKNVFLCPNIPFDVLRDELAKSIIFLHTSKYEPFGISTVEAISAGCIPIVHNSGGQKEVVPFKELRFNNKNEAIKKINFVLNMNSKELNSYRKKLQEHVKQFDVEIFKKKIISYVDINKCSSKIKNE